MYTFIPHDFRFPRLILIFPHLEQQWLLIERVLEPKFLKKETDEWSHDLDSC